MTSGRLPIGRKVIDLAGEPRPYLSTDERAELVRSCPRPYDRTLDAMIALGYKTGRCWAGLDAIAAKAKTSRATVVRHRAWLVEAGYLIPQGGGHRGRNASFVIRTPAERAAQTTPPAWARIADPDLRAEVLRLDV